MLQFSYPDGRQGNAEVRPESRSGGYTDGRQRGAVSPLPLFASGSPYSMDLPSPLPFPLANHPGLVEDTPWRTA